MELNIKDLRLGLGMSQQAFADALSVPKDRVAKWEQRNINPKAADYNKVLKLMKDNVPQGTVHSGEVELSKELGIIKEREIYLTASVSVLEQMIDKLVSDQTGKAIALVSGERKKATQMEVERLLNELKKRYEKA